MVQPERVDDKVAALRQTGALHSRPQSVTDPLFRSLPFFDARDLVQVKYEMLRRVQAEGQPVTQTAATFGFSRVSFYQAQSVFGKQGLPGLVPRRRGPRRAHKLNERVVDFLEQAKTEDPAPRTRDLVERVRSAFGVDVHPRSIERALARRSKKP